MANITKKTLDNIYYQARMEAAQKNEFLSSREGAADIMSIDRGRLYRIETGVAQPYPEEVHLMADLYLCPELRNYYCKNACPLGCDFPDVMATSIDRITVRAMATLRGIEATKDALLDITLDGDVNETEMPQMKDVLEKLDEISSIAASLRCWIEKEGGAK